MNMNSVTVRGEPAQVPNLDDLNQLASRAWHGTSFTPERRGESFIKEYSDILTSDLKELPAEKHDYYISRFKTLLRAYLRSHSNVMSSMITGPSNFPTERNRKRGDWADAKINAFYAWRKWFFEKGEKEARKAAIVEAGGELEIAKRHLINLKKLHEDGLKANKIIKAAIKLKLNPAELREQLKDLDLGRWLDFTIKYYALGEYHFCGIFSPNTRAKVKHWEARVKELERRENSLPVEVVAPDESGIRVVQNTPINRVQIFFPGKPDEATRSNLKGNGFRWSPNNGCWQAYINYRSIPFAKSFLTTNTVAA